MWISLYSKLQRSQAKKLFCLQFLFMLMCQDVWALQDALVIAEKAIVYSDEEMTSAVGYLARGKKIKIGDSPRNKSQVYPIIVSGKMAYVRTGDISTLTSGAEVFVSERFHKQATEEQVKTNLSMAYYNYSSQILLDSTNGSIDDKDSLVWSGFTLKGRGIVKNRWELQLIANFMSTSQEDEEFKAVETGLGGGYRFMEWGRLSGRVEAQALAIPWCSYSNSDDFRVVGQGFSTGAAVSLSLRLSNHWGIDGYTGVYYTRLTNFDVPRPFSSIEPILYGTRLGGGIHYTF